MRRQILATLMLAAAASLRAQDTALIRAADSIFAPYSSTRSPGCAVGASRDGQTVLSRAYGMADLETNTPNTPETIFESGSVAKQFTATAILLLERDGKLKLDDDVRKYVPELPAYDRPITIRNLLTHTSGLRDWGSLMALAGWPRGERAHTQADLLDMVFRQKALNYPVGEYYSYTNTGYALSAAIVERVSGQSFQRFTHDRIFAPLGMTHTQWRDDFTRLVPGRAQAYEKKDDGWHLLMPFETVYGPGGMLTTVADWLAWEDALAHDRLFPGHAVALSTSMRLNSGRTIHYAFGVVNDSYRGLGEISHSGGTAGYTTYLMRIPSRGNLAVAVLCNTPVWTWSLAHGIADHMITDFPAPPPLDTSRADSAALAAHYGTYLNTRDHSVFTFDAAGARDLRALPGGWYRRPGGDRLFFAPGATGRPADLLIVDDESDTLRLEAKGSAWKPTRPQMQQYVGTYVSDELNTRYVVKLAGDSLVLSIRPAQALTLTPTYQDAFDSDLASIWFTRDRSGNVAVMHLSEGRVWDLVAPRVK